MFTRFARSSAIRRAFYTTEVPSGLNEGEKHIFKKLSEAFSPIRLQVADVSGKYTWNRVSLLTNNIHERWLWFHVCY